MTSNGIISRRSRFINIVVSFHPLLRKYIKRNLLDTRLSVILIGGTDLINEILGKE